MKKIWLNIKAVFIIILAFAVFIIMTFATFVYGLVNGIRQMRVTKPADE